MASHSKNDLIQLIEQSGVCPLSNNKLMKMSKADLKTMYVNILKTIKKSSSNKQPIKSESSNDESQSKSDKSDNEQEEEEKEPMVKKTSPNELRKTIKHHYMEFTKIVNQLIRAYRNDNDKEHLVDQYNIEFADIENTMHYILQNEDDDELFEYADSLISVQTNRIKRIK